MALIKGMEMPIACETCPFRQFLVGGDVNSVYCLRTRSHGNREEYCHRRMEDCPLIEVDFVIGQMEAAKFVDPDGIDRDKRYNDGIRACIAILRGLEEK